MGPYSGDLALTDAEQAALGVAVLGESLALSGLAVAIRRAITAAR